MNAEKYARWEQQDLKMRVVGKVIAYLTVALLAFMFYVAFDQNAAMKECQAKGFSFDTCFHSLNR